MHDTLAPPTPRPTPMPTRLVMISDEIVRRTHDASKALRLALLGGFISHQAVALALADLEIANRMAYCLQTEAAKGHRS